MKKTILLIVAFLSQMLGMAQYGTQFENRGFESWANFGSSANTIEPVHWHSGMSADGSFTGFLSQQIEPSTIVRPGSAGTQSVRVWARSVMGIIANGNITNGRMHAGSMSASGSNNYNYTLRSDERFNTPISVVPDSLTVWVCFRCNNVNQNAQARAVVHGDADLRTMANGAVEPEDQLVATALLNFNRTSEAGTDYQWRRLSIPFVQNGPSDDPHYILFTLTTNEVPGDGATSDELFIDDVLLVYNPTLQMAALPQNHYETGESLDIDFTLDGTMSPENLGGEPNQVIAQLSAANGSFSNPTELGRMTTDVSGTLHVKLPDGILYGEHYRIRLVSTNYPMISEDNGTDLTIGSTVSVMETAIEEDVQDAVMYDLTGRRVTENKPSPGIYLVRYRTGDGYVCKKILIQ